MLFRFLLLTWTVVSLHAEESCTDEGSCKDDPSVTTKESKLRDFTVSQLQEYTGASEKLPLYVALLGDVYDVSASADLYGKCRPFHCYAGKDASLAIAQNSCDQALFPASPLDQSRVKDLSAPIQTSLSEWIKVFQQDFKYPIVGKVSLPESHRDFSLESLATRTGQPEHLLPHRIHSEILICLNYKVFDVSYGGQSMYGIGKGYHLFAGKDASRALAMMSFDSEYLENNDLSLLSEEEMEGVLSWEATFLSKYPVVGSCK